MKKFLLSLSAALVLCVPAFADNEVYFAALPSSYTTVSNNRIDFSSSGNVYSFCQYSDSDNQYFSFICCSTSSATVDVYRNGEFYGTQTLNPVVDLDNFYVTNGYSVQTGASLDPAIDIIPYSWSISDIASAFSDFLMSSGGGGSVPSSFTVPRGNVLYFQVASNSDVNFVSNFSENSALFSSGNVYGPWGDTYQRISAEASLPVPGIEFPRSGSDAIVWAKGEPLNVLGQTKVGVFTKSCSAGTYYAFYNPAYQSISGSDGFGSTSVGSNVTVSGNFSFIRIYSLQQLLDISTSTNGYDDYYVGTPDGNGGVTWVDQDNQVDYPSSGGENQEDEPISSVSLIESIKRILRNILSEIESIFTFGFSAIRDLVDLMDEFVATFDDLYEWLPDECYTLLIACVSVAIAIGVFKVFL